MAWGLISVVQQKREGGDKKGAQEGRGVRVRRRREGRGTAKRQRKIARCVTVCGPGARAGPAQACRSHFCAAPGRLRQPQEDEGRGGWGLAALARIRRRSRTANTWAGRGGRRVAFSVFVLPALGFVAFLLSVIFGLSVVGFCGVGLRFPGALIGLGMYPLWTFPDSVHPLRGVVFVVRAGILRSLFLPYFLLNCSLSPSFFRADVPR